MVTTGNAIVDLLHYDLTGITRTFRVGCPAKIDIARGSNVTFFPQDVYLPQKDVRKLKLIIYTNIMTYIVLTKQKYEYA